MAESPAVRTREEVMAAPIAGDFAIEHWRKTESAVSPIYWDLAVLWLDEPSDIYAVVWDALASALGCDYMRINRYVGPSVAEGGNYNGWLSMGVWSAETGVKWATS